MRRWVSLVLACAMIWPAAASIAEGAMATWLAPQPGQIVSGGKVEVSIGYNTQSNLRVSSLELYIDGQFYARKILRDPEPRGVCSFAWDTTRVEQGAHNLVVKVYAGDQVISKVYGTGTVGPNGSSGLLDVRPPVVTFANVRAGDVIKGTKLIKLNAQDDSGKPPMVSLLVDENLKLLKNTPPYTYSLDTTTYADGDHSLKTYAYDEAGNRSDPAVIKVAFRNGGEKPVVTTMTVNPKEVAPAPEPAKATQVTPPSVAAEVAPSIKHSAAREAPSVAAPSAVAPVVAESTKPIAPKPVAAAVPKPAAHVAVAPKPAPPVKMAAPALSSSPVRMALATGSTDLRKENLKPLRIASAKAAKPVVMAEPSLSGVHNRNATSLPGARQTLIPAPALAKGAKPALPKQIAVATPKPVAAAPKTIMPKPMSAAPKPVAPKHIVVAPKASAPVRMAMASVLPTTRQVIQKTTASAAVTAAPRIVEKPIAAAAKTTPIEHRAVVKPVAIAAPAVAGAQPVAPKVVSAPRISKAALKRVRVAMLPKIRPETEQTVPSAAISSPPAVPKPVKARLQKATIPASGKVKARKFFEEMGGILFWDPTTHTVTACVQHMVFEMKIGSKTAKVNGHEFKMDSTPRLVGGRTFFEARSFAQACELLDSLRLVGKAEVR